MLNGSCHALMNFLEIPEKDGRKMNSFLSILIQKCSRGSMPPQPLAA